MYDTSTKKKDYEYVRRLLCVVVDTERYNIGRYDILSAGGWTNTMPAVCRVLACKPRLIPAPLESLPDVPYDIVCMFFL